MAHQNIQVDPIPNDRTPDFYAGVVAGNTQIQQLNAENNKGAWKVVLALIVSGAALIGGGGWVAGYLAGHSHA